ncbi:MAG: plastocyanin/azurin family copper-binding protein [Actinomycetota bacterium]
MTRLGPGAGGGDRRSRPAARRFAAAVLALVALAAAGCARANAGGRAHLTVDVRIHHSAFAPSRFTFARGTTVTFVIHNTDPIEHEFIVGDETVQYYVEHTAHLGHDGSVPGQISIPAGETRTTTYTFTTVARRPGDMEFACHLPGHFRYGMHGPITITG